MSRKAKSDNRGGDGDRPALPAAGVSRGTRAERPTYAPSQAGLIPNLSLNSGRRLRRSTEDQQLLERQEIRSPLSFDFTRMDPWRVMRISSEFVQGFDALAHLNPAVAIFGSARTRPGAPDYE